MPSDTPLTARQQEIWQFLVMYVDDHGYPPTVREIGEEVGLASPSTVHAHLANLERAGMLRRDPTKPRALEVREVGVHGRGRGEPDLLADLAHGRWIAVPVDVLDEVVPDLLLPLCEHLAPPVTNMCSVTVAWLSDGVKPADGYNALRALVAELVDAQG